MGYENEELLVDKNKTPIPQAIDPVTGKFVPLTTAMFGGGGGGNSYGVFKSGETIMSASQSNNVLELIEGEGIEIELINKAITGFNDQIKISRLPIDYAEIISKPFETLSSDFIVDENGVISIDRNKVSGGAGGGMPFVNITDFKVFEGSDTEATAYGAKGDKFTSGQIDTIAFERSFRLAKDNGSVNIYIPDGHYILNQPIQLYPNTNVQMSRNAVIRKNHDSPMFSNSQPNEWFLGYSGRGKIYWTGGTLDCKDGSGLKDSAGLPLGTAREGSTFSLVNAEYFEFKSIIFLDQRNTHHFDLSGIRNIVVGECYFYGYTYDTKNPDGTDIPADKIRAYSECVQLDYSSHQAMPSQNTGHDGTACQFVFVQNCKFDKSDQYPSWNRCVGMHNVYFPTYNWLCNTDGTLTGNNFNFEYSKAKNVYINNNEIYGNGTMIHDYYTVNPTTGEKTYDPQGFIIQMIRLLNVDNVYISGNKFDSVKGGISFDCDQSSKTMTDTDAQRDFSTTNSGHLMPYSVEWTDNRGDKQKILYSESTSDKGTKVTTYTQYGKTYTITWAKTAKVLDYYGISNCHVLFNTFKNVTAGIRDVNGVAMYQPSTPIYVRGECRTKASATLQGTRANKVILMGNIIDGIETVPVENQSRLASSQGLVISPPGTTGAAWTPNIVSAISATYTRNLTIIGNEIRNCSRAIYTSGCNRALINNNQLFTIYDTEAICVVGGSIYQVTNNTMDNLYDSAIRMKGTDLFFVEGNTITNTNKGALWQIDVPFFQYNPKDKPTIWVEVDGSGGSNFGTVINNKIYSSFASNFIKYPIYIGDENTYVKSSNFFFGSYQFDNNVDLNFSDCGLDTAFRGNDAETLNGYSVDKLKDLFVELQLLGKPSGIVPLNGSGVIDAKYLPTTGGAVGFKTFSLPNGETITATTLANTLTLQGSDGIVFDAKDGNILEIKYGNDSLVQHIPTIDLAIEELNDNMVIVSGQMDVLNVWKTDLINNILTSIDNRLDSLETNKEDKSNKNIADGYAGLDHNVKIPLNLIPDSLLGKADYKGLWDASVNIPDLTEIKPKGDYYIVGVNGTFLGVDYVVKDWIISNGTSWDKVDNTDAVSSVQGRTGNVVLTKADVGLGNAQDTSDVNKPVSTATQTELNKKLDKTGGQMTGNIGLLKYEEKIGTATGGVCDLSTGNIFNIPVSANTTLSFTNVSATTGYAQSVVLYLVMAGTYSVTFPASVKWHNGALPDISAIKTHEIVCRTLDNGVTWLASLGGSF